MRTLGAWLDRDMLIAVALVIFALTCFAVGVSGMPPL